MLEQLSAFVTAIGLDFGTIDAVCDNEGRHYIIDLNTTPFYRTQDPDIVDHLGGDQ